MRGNEHGRPERVLFVHAHPDDESLSTGGTIAALTDGGAAVTVLTCTRGELGEVIPDELTGLAGRPDLLAARRTAELADAMDALGVTDHRLLGEPGARRVDLEPRRYTDSGMRWGENGAEASEEFADDSLGAARFGEVAADVATVIDEVQPDAVVSYDERGGYGHPDHQMAHDAARSAAEVFGIPFFQITESGQADLRVDVTPFLARKRAAIAAHRTQAVVDGDSYRLSSGGPKPIATAESFTRVWPAGSEPVPWKEQGFGSHLLSYLLALVVGIAVGGIATVNHQISFTVAGVSLPIGITAAIVVIGALLAGLRLVFGGRQVAGFAALGVLATILFLSMSGDGGSVLVPGNPAGYVLSIAPVAIALVVLGWPAGGAARRDRIVVRPEPRGTTAP
jgi:N-acetyl-1-D-myo-inositol-2-amino-2-deoxy-alpha-D-glucopyranoside deacetylase